MTQEEGTKWWASSFRWNGEHTFIYRGRRTLWGPVYSVRGESTELDHIKPPPFPYCSHYGKSCQIFYRKYDQSYYDNDVCGALKLKDTHLHIIIYIYTFVKILFNKSFFFTSVKVSWEYHIYLNSILSRQKSSSEMMYSEQLKYLRLVKNFNSLMIKSRHSFPFVYLSLYLFILILYLYRLCFSKFIGCFEEVLEC